MLTIRPAVTKDYGEIMTLQRASFVDEARLYGTPDVPALNESAQELSDRLAKSRTWVAIDQTRIIGAVSLRAYRGDPDIERLMVAPDRRGEKISSQLLAAAEHAAIKSNIRSLQLIVGDLAVDNQRIYAHLGWHRVSSFQLAGYEGVLLHNMAKCIAI